MTDQASNKNEYVVVAQLESLSKEIPYIKARVFSESPDRFAVGKTLFIEFFGQMKPIVVEDFFMKKSAFFICFRNFSSQDECSVLLGKYIYIHAEDIAQLPDDSFYVHDLIGSEVIASGESLGVISDVMFLPANDVYVVKQSAGNEVLIPALKSVIKSFDRNRKVLELSVPKSYFVDEI